MGFMGLSHHRDFRGEEFMGLPLVFEPVPAIIEVKATYLGPQLSRNGHHLDSARRVLAGYQTAMDREQ
jgi:hypothetical protein